MKILKSKKFSNGVVYALETKDGYKIETTDTFLPYYTKHSTLKDCNPASRLERWMIGVSCMSGCPVGCKFCATGKMKRYRNLTSSEIVEQVEFVISNNKEYTFSNAKEYKINYTRMGEPFLNIENVKAAISEIESKYPGTHHYVSTIGVLGSDFSFVKENVTLQISLHSCNEESRNSLIPYSKKMSIPELGQIRTGSNLKTTVNLTLPCEEDFDIDVIRKNFDSDMFFLKLSPVNSNEISNSNNIFGVETKEPR